MRVLLSLTLILSACSIQIRGKPKVSKEELELEKKIAEALLLKNSEAAEDLTEKTESLMDSVGLLSEEPGKNQVVDSALDTLLYATQHYQELKEREKQKKSSSNGSFA